MVKINWPASLAMLNWPFNTDSFLSGTDPDLPGSLKLVSAEPDKLKVKWTPPGAIDTTMSYYLVSN